MSIFHKCCCGCDFNIFHLKIILNKTFVAFREESKATKKQKTERNEDKKKQHERDKNNIFDLTIYVF